MALLQIHTSITFTIEFITIVCEKVQDHSFATDLVGLSFIEMLLTDSSTITVIQWTLYS